jgi:hypothetical protein
MSDDYVNKWVDIELLREIMECAGRISDLYRELVAPFLDPDVLLGNRTITSSQEQNVTYEKLQHELKALNSLITGINRNRYKIFTKNFQLTVKLTLISFNTVKEYMVLTSEAYSESRQTDDETDLYEKSSDVAIECRSKVKRLADMLTQHKEIFDDEIDVSEFYVVYKDWEMTRKEREEKR